MATLNLNNLGSSSTPGPTNTMNLPPASAALNTGKKLAAKPTKPRKPKAGGGLAAALAQKQLV